MARKLLVAAYCYYVHHYSLISDAEYDRMSRIVADHFRDLDPCRQWAMESPDSLRSTGYHFKYTRYNVSAARQLLHDKGVDVGDYPKDWKYNKKYGSYRTGGM